MTNEHTDDKHLDTPPETDTGTHEGQTAETEENVPRHEAAEEPAMLRIVAVKFRDAGKLYDFDARGFDLRHGSQVVVETDRGRALGTVVLDPRETPRSKAPDGLKSVLRLANDKDIESAQRHATREQEALRFCRDRVSERNLEMKLVKAEYLFDGSKIIFYFTADGRIDFRELVKDLAHHFHTRIEMRQIGVRDEAKLLGGIGVCGRELCCCSFLREFDPVSVKMAKEQGLALNPSKISGQCGRLLCCLGYEYETYCSLRKGLPKCGRKVSLGETAVEVAQIDLLRQQVTVRYEDNHTEVVSADEIRSGTLQPPAAAENKPREEKQPPRRERPQREPRRRDENRAENREEKKPQVPQPDNAPQAAATTEGEAPAGERKKRRRPRRRRGRRGGSPEGGPPKPTNPGNSD